MTTARRRGGGRREAAPPPRPWRDRLEDPDEPLFTVGVVADLLEVDTQTVRRLEEAAAHISARPSGNQRRYSRTDIEVLASAQDLARGGMPVGAIPRIMELERQVEDLRPARGSSPSR